MANNNPIKKPQIVKNDTKLSVVIKNFPFVKIAQLIA